MPDLEWAPCEHASRVSEQTYSDPPWPRREQCADCGKTVLVYEDGTVVNEVRGL